MKKQRYSLLVIVLFFILINGCSDEPPVCPAALACPSNAPWWGAGITCYTTKNKCEYVWGKGNCLKCI